MSWCTMRLSSQLNFGKYKGRAVRDLIESDPYYLKWAIENTNSHPSQEVLDALEAKGFKDLKLKKAAKTRLRNKTINDYK